ncbi:hypothetical protein ACEWY4_001707 [Coilia grayii]|uniref:Uncharacterized protein n=1 Tax=Coilia grayii TaxID=363190 RepID=A0ABD1KTP0_9TELE
MLTSRGSGVTIRETGGCEGPCVLVCCFSLFGGPGHCWQPFNGSAYHVRTSCSFTLTRFTHQGVQCDITAQRGVSGLVKRVEIVINKVRTIILSDGDMTVGNHRVSLPYDHTYQHIFPYGAYTRLSSTVLPLTVTWHDNTRGIDSVWDCQRIMSLSVTCLRIWTEHYYHLCSQNAYGQTGGLHVTCPFFRDLAHKCGPGTSTWRDWKDLTKCPDYVCPGDLTFQELGHAFIPTCSNPTPRVCEQDMTSTCVCPTGKVLNDRAEGHRCVSLAECPCVHYSKTYPSGSNRNTKCQTCVSYFHSRFELVMMSPDPVIKIIHFSVLQVLSTSQLTKTHDTASAWMVTIHFADQGIKLQKVEVHIHNETYVFSDSRVMFQNQEITDFHQVHHGYATVFWQSSLLVKVKLLSGLCGNFNWDSGDDFTTSSGIVENSVEPFAFSWAMWMCTSDISPMCTDIDQVTLSLTLPGHGPKKRPSGLLEKLKVSLKQTLAVDRGSACRPFLSGHSLDPAYTWLKPFVVPPEGSQTPHLRSARFRRAGLNLGNIQLACVSKTCQCHSPPESCLCVAFGNYAKACASVGKPVGDWRNVTNCVVSCMSNQVFDYNTRSCNRTCHAVADHDPTCNLDAEPVEGCGCPEGSYRNYQGSCVPTSMCDCYFRGFPVPPGRSTMGGFICSCENARINCTRADFCRGCPPGQVCVDCLSPTDETQNTCDSLSKPSIEPVCFPGCYCPVGQYLDDFGECVSAVNCTCMFSGKIFRPGESVKTNCKICTCSEGRWHCSGEPCPGRCQVFGNGQYQTFDFKWFRFDGSCQYTLVEDDCGSGMGNFSVRVESIPCCDEELTCSRTITLDVDGMYLVFGQTDMSEMYYKKEGRDIVVERVGLYIVASVKSLGLTLIWDKNTRLTVLLDVKWKSKVCGLCGNFDSSEANDLQDGSALEFGNSWKTGTPPCSDVKNETFPCERHSYCANWAQRRCMIITGDTFKACHLKVDPVPYYDACVLEACACQFEGRFLGFCTAVAAYAEACSEQDICIRWRTPERCPVFCDYYNIGSQCTWHYDPCGKAMICGNNHFKGKLEGCFPRCPEHTPYYDENTGKCTILQNCTCPDLPPGCECVNGTVNCGRCEVFSDPHYITFQGNYYRFMGACTYVLVQERSSRYNFSIMVDNAHCFGITTISCARGATLNNVPVGPRHEQHGIRFDSTPSSVSVDIEEIRTHISMATGARVTITLAMEHFQNNTEGQCGVCGGSSCVRPSGRVENDDCCPQTAYDWTYPDPSKPQCRTAPRNVSCDPHPSPPPTSCPPSPECEILHGPVFEKCRGVVNLTTWYQSCWFDVCTTGLKNLSCFSLAEAAEVCQTQGVCVDWCKHTNGTCKCFIDQTSDIVFLLDGSGSVSSRDFRSMIDFVVRLIRRLQSGNMQIRLSRIKLTMYVIGSFQFAIAQYSSMTTIHMDFNQFNRSGMWESQVMGITQLSGGTFTAAAISKVVNEVFVPAAGLRSFANKVLIVITDGQSSDSLKLESIIAKAEKMGITRYSIGVGRAFMGSGLMELQRIASSSENHVFHVDNFAALEQISSALERIILGMSTTTSIHLNYNETNNSIQVNYNENDSSIHLNYNDNDSSIHLNYNHNDSSIHLNYSENDSSIHLSYNENDSSIDLNYNDNDSSIHLNYNDNDSSIHLNYSENDSSIHLNYNDNDSSIHLNYNENNSSIHLNYNENSSTHFIYNDNIFSSFYKPNLPHCTKD